MKSRFDWQTEEETGWEENLVPVPAAGKRPFLLVALLFLAMIAGGIGIYQQVAGRISVATTAITADIISSHNLLQQADRNRDDELFDSLLSGRDPRWTAAQKSLFNENLVGDRALLGLGQQTLAAPLDPAALADTAVSLTINPELTEATLVVPTSYTRVLPSGATEMVVLSQTAVYRRGSQRWLYAPPAPDFWGEWRTTTGRRLTITYPARDNDLATRLLADLDDALDTACQSLTMLNCPADLRLLLRLGTEPDLLLAATNVTASAANPVQLELPTPTLVGVPLDPTSYEVVLAAYARPVLTAAITRVVGWECCRRAPIYAALVDYHLAQLGYRDWPVSADSYLRLLLEDVGTRELLTAWSRTDFDYLQGERGWLVYTAVDFLLQREPNQNAAAMMRQLMLQPTLSEWIGALHGGGIDKRTSIIQQMETEWRDYAYTRTATLTPPQPLPDQDIFALCSGKSVPGDVMLYRYLTAGQQWQEGQELPFSYINLLPPGQDVVVQQLAYNPDVARNQTLIWQGGALRPLTAVSSSLSFGQSDPSGRYLLAYITDSPSGGAPPSPYLFDLTTCRDESCESQPVSGLPIWSAAGDRAIVTRNETPAVSTHFLVQGRYFVFSAKTPLRAWDLILTDRQLRPIRSQPIGYGYAPFWVDADRIGFLREMPNDEQALVMVTLPDGEAQTIITSRDLLAVVSADAQPLSLEMRYALASPTNPNLIIVTAFDQRQRDAYIFSYDVALATAELRVQLGNEYDHSLEISPDGRFLVVTGTKTVSGSTALRGTTLIHDLAAGTTTELLTAQPAFLPTSAHDWTEDGRWLLTNINDHVFGLMAPELAFQQVLRHDLGQCTAIFWVDPLP